MKITIKHISMLVILSTWIMCIMACLTGCVGVERSSSAPEQEYLGENMVLFIDPETGVNYYRYDGYCKCAIILRVNADGTPYVTKKK